MALDGIFLHAIYLELKNWIGSRVEKVLQIAKFDFLLEFRQPKDRAQLFISANPGFSRINFTKKEFKQQKESSRFFVILQDYLQGAWFVRTEQKGFDRVLFLEFKKSDDFGSVQKFVLAIEIIGKRSNLILFQKHDKKIVDAARWLNGELLKQRPVEPGMVYCSVETQNKLNILSCDFDSVLRRLFLNSNLSFSRAIGETVEGVSPVVAREMALDFGQKPLIEFDEAERVAVVKVLENFKKLVESKEFKFFVFMDGVVPKEFCWFELKQFGSLLNAREFDSASELLEFFCDEKVSVERISHQRCNIIERIKNKIEQLSVEKFSKLGVISKIENFEKYRVYADLLSANLHRIKRGELSVKLENFFGGGEEIEISLDQAKTPMQNVQFYYKKFSELKAKCFKLKNEVADLDDLILFLKREFDLVLCAKTKSEVLAVLDNLASKGF